MNVVFKSRMREALFTFLFAALVFAPLIGVVFLAVAYPLIGIAIILAWVLGYTVRSFIQ